MPSADEDTWAEVERAYVETDETITSICARLGVPASTLQRRAVVHGWPRRKGRAGRPAQATGVVTVGSVEAARNDVARRLYRRMSQKLTKMEQDAETAGPEPAAADPDDRMLTALIRQFEKLTGLDGLRERWLRQAPDLVSRHVPRARAAAVRAPRRGPHPQRDRRTPGEAPPRPPTKGRLRVSSSPGFTVRGSNS